MFRQKWLTLTVLQLGGEAMREDIYRLMIVIFTSWLVLLALLTFILQITA